MIYTQRRHSNAETRTRRNKRIDKGRLPDKGRGKREQKPPVSLASEQGEGHDQRQDKERDIVCAQFCLCDVHVQHQPRWLWPPVRAGLRWPTHTYSDCVQVAGGSMGTHKLTGPWALTSWFLISFWVLGGVREQQSLLITENQKEIHRKKSIE